MVQIKDLQGYLGYQFSSGSYIGEDYKLFQDKYIKYLRSMCKANHWELVNIGKNHYEFSVFVKSADKYVYLSIPDVRYEQDGWYKNILVRKAKSEKDYTGGHNMFTRLTLLQQDISRLLEEQKQ